LLSGKDLGGLCLGILYHSGGGSLTYEALVQCKVALAALKQVNQRSRS